MSRNIRLGSAILSRVCPFVFISSHFPHGISKYYFAQNMSLLQKSRQRTHFCLFNSGIGSKGRTIAHLFFGDPPIVGRRAAILNGSNNVASAYSWYSRLPEFVPRLPSGKVRACACRYR